MSPASRLHSKKRREKEPRLGREKKHTVGGQQGSVEKGRVETRNLDFRQGLHGMK